MKKKEMLPAVKELNDALGLDPKIDTKSSVETIKEQLLEAEELIEPDDEISKETMKILKELKEEEKPVSDTEEEEEEDFDADEDISDDDDEEEEEEEEPAPKKKTKTVTIKGKISIPKERLFPKSSMTRAQAAGAVISKAKGKKITEVISESDKAYVEAGGKSNIKEMRNTTNIALQVLETYGVIKVNEGVIK